MKELPQQITIDLAPTFGENDADIGRVRNNQASWAGEMGMTADSIFSIEIPLEVVGVAPNGNGLWPRQSSLTFAPAGDVTVQGIAPDPSVRDVFLTGGRLDMNVDSLSRSIILTDVDERTLVDVLGKRADIDAENLEALKRTLLVPTFYDDLNHEAATQAHQLLTENVRRHEREHINCLIDLETALWREVELYWRSTLVGTSKRSSSDFLDRLAAIYVTPSHFIVELLAILAEDYASDAPTVQKTVRESVADQRGAVGAFTRFIDDHNLDAEALHDKLRAPVGEQYCDLWLVYLLDKLRSGYALSEIDTAGFYETCDTVAGSYDDIVRDTETRTEFVNFIRELCFGPAVESVRLKFTNGQLLLERAWFSLNPSVSDAGNRLAVRQALFRRELMSTFGTESGLADVLSAREAAVERVIRGAPLDEVPLYDVSLPSSKRISESLATAHEAAANTLLGSQASVEDLQGWLNDPEYGIEQIHGEQ